MKFTVFDKLTGEEADIIEIALKEGDWAKSLIYCDMEGFAIEEDGTLLLLDECGNFAYCPEDRFEVHIATMQEKDKEIAELKAEVSAWKETSQLLVKDGVKYNKQIAELKATCKGWEDGHNKLMDDIAELKAENERLTSKVKHLQISYGDLIMTVGDKYPDESRHEIARRYILEAETQNSVSCKAVEALEDQK